MTSLPLLSLRNVSVQYAGAARKAVSDISFSVQPGSITMLVGPNGSGKSTLIKAVLGILPHLGEITVNLPKITTHERTTFGYVPQRLDFDMDLPVTVEEFLALALTACDHSGKQKQIMITEALNSVNASKLRHRSVGSLSGGQRQRVVVARALIHHPHILVLDEPESGIDVKGEEQFYQLLQEIVTTQQAAALIATHDLHAVHEYADQVIHIAHEHTH